MNSRDVGYSERWSSIDFVQVSSDREIYNKYVIRKIVRPRNGIMDSLGLREVVDEDAVVLTDCVTQFGPHDKSTCCAAVTYVWLMGCV